jgi:hypothetical protein
MKESVTTKLQAQLQSLRTVLPSENGGPLLRVFDEFMQQHEFGLALHVVCDFILDRDPPWVDKSILEWVESLHAVMGIDDGCVQALRNKKAVRQ